MSAFDPAGYGQQAVDLNLVSSEWAILARPKTGHQTLLLFRKKKTHTQSIATVTVETFRCKDKARKIPSGWDKLWDLFVHSWPLWWDGICTVRPPWSNGTGKVAWTLTHSHQHITFSYSSAQSNTPTRLMQCNSPKMVAHMCIRDRTSPCLPCIDQRCFPSAVCWWKSTHK